MSDTHTLDSHTRARPTAATGTPAPRRIVFLDHTAALGGGEIALLNLVQQFNPDRYFPIVVLFNDGPLANALKAAGIDTRILPLNPAVASTRKDTLGPASLLHFKRFWLSICFVFSLARLLRDLKPDIVHTNSLKSDILGGFAARLAGIPVIWHIRDRIEGDYLPPFSVRLFRFLSRWLPNFIIANSGATLDTLRLGPRKGGSVLYSGIDVRARVVHDGTETDAPTARPRPSGAGGGPLIGLVGRISPWKGQHIFLQAAAMVRRQFPQARFQIVGAALFSEEAYEKEVRDLAATLNLTDAVEFTGFRKDVPDLVAGLDVLVHASTTGEPFGQVVIEGMAAAKPIVATRGGGIPEIVIDGVTGLLVPMGDAAAMASAICRLLENPALARRMGQRGRQRALEQFTIEHTAEQAQALYDELLTPRQKSPKPGGREPSAAAFISRRRMFLLHLTAFVLSIAAYAVAYYFNLTLGTHGPKFPVFFAAILLSTWFGGLGPGITAVITCLVGAAVILPPNYSLAIQSEDIPAFIFFAVVSLLTVVLIEQLHVARRQAQALQRQADDSRVRAAFLARATTAISVSPDDRSVLVDLAHLAVPFVADWVLLDRVDSAGNVRRAVVLHHDSARTAILHELSAEAPALMSASPIAVVLRTGVVKRIANPMDTAGNGSLSNRPELLEQLGVTACLIVPLIVRSRTLGAMTLVRSRRDWPFLLEDVNLATELASRAALALEDAPGSEGVYPPDRKIPEFRGILA